MILKLGEREFALKPTPPKGGAVMVLSKRLHSGSEQAKAAALYDFIAGLCESADGLDEALVDLDLDEIQAAISEAMKTYTEVPTVASSPSPAGSPPTAPTSKVVSFSRGTVEQTA